MATAGDDYILIVEDDHGIREGLEFALLLEGYRVESAEDGQAALRRLKTGRKPCLILLDLMMPVMDGWTLRRELLKDPALADIPVVVMTAAGLEASRDLGPLMTIQKPLEIDTVLDVVRQHCPLPIYSAPPRLGQA